MIPRWRDVLIRYRAGTTLKTVAQDRPFSVVTSEDRLLITPSATGKVRGLTQRDFERAAPMLQQGGETQAVTEATQNSAYIRAILRDFERDD